MESFLKEVSLETKGSEMLGLEANNKKLLRFLLEVKMDLSVKGWRKEKSKCPGWASQGCLVTNRWIRSHSIPSGTRRMRNNQWWHQRKVWMNMSSFRKAQNYFHKTMKYRVKNTVKRKKWLKILNQQFSVLVTGPFYNHENYWGPQMAIVYVGFIYWYLLYQKLKWRNVKNSIYSLLHLL